MNSNQALPILDCDTIETAPDLPLQDGAVLLVDKPADITSFGVVARVRRMTGVRKVGHCGTLDPFATGLLIVLVGKKATRTQDAMMGQSKEYHARLRFGVTSDTLDRTGMLRSTWEGVCPFDEEHLEDCLAGFRGEIKQVPPMYSALKQGGERLYQKARRGEEVVREPRDVVIHHLRADSLKWPFLDLTVDCSKGTYIRSLAADIGERLGVGALVEELRRTRIGEHHVSRALSLDQLQQAFSKKVTQHD